MKMFAIMAGMLMVIGAFAGLSYGLVGDESDANADTDRDGLKNGQEFLYGTDPLDPDSDGAGCYDGWEIWYENHRATELGAYHFDPNAGSDEGVVADMYNLIMVRDGDANVAVNDPDGDGWNNFHEFLVGSDPTNPNTDGDGYQLDSSDPDPLISTNPSTGGGDGNGGGGSGIGEAVVFA